MSFVEPPVPMPVERPTTLYLNDAELLTIQTTPVALDDWAMGFLFTEGIITAPADVLRLAVDEDKGLIWADVDPTRLGDREFGSKRYLTSGCGRGVTFSSVKDAMLLQPVRHDLQVSREQLGTWMQRMGQATPLYEETGGMHACAAVHVPTEELVVREDIGRHNAVDKAIGAVLKLSWPPAEVVMLTSGRISYEMCSKLARFGVGIGASRTAATDQAYRLAVRLGIDLVGYLRGPRHMTLYTPGRRIRQEAPATGG